MVVGSGSEQLVQGDAFKLQTNIECKQLTYDHKPNDEFERKRIIKVGGKVTEGNPARISGLATSRTLGDTMAHNVGVSDEPDVKVVYHKDDKAQILIIASDGLWD